MRKLYGPDPSSKKRHSNTVPKPPPSTPSQPLRYYLGSGNNSSLIRRVLSLRPQWSQCTDSKQLFLHLRWHQSNRGFKYENCIEHRVYKHALNHFEHHMQLSNKQLLFRNLQQHCLTININVFDIVPITFILNLSKGSFEQDLTHFEQFYRQHHPVQQPSLPLPNSTLHFEKRRISQRRHISLTSLKDTNYNQVTIPPPFVQSETAYLWILKPTFMNQGTGIHVFKQLSQMETLVNKYVAGYCLTPKTTNDFAKKGFRIRESAAQAVIRTSSFVVQKYLQKPLLFSGRKFDIRMWVLITHELQVLLYRQGYLRTSSYAYDLSQSRLDDPNVHLTNNAIQKNTDAYGRYEQGNQLGFSHLRRLLREMDVDYEEMMGKIKNIVKIATLAVRRKINREHRRNCFEIFGFDFMLDHSAKPWLIEVNTNPCLAQSSPLLEDLLPKMLDQAFSLTIDRIFNRATPQKNTQKEPHCDWEFIVNLN